MWINARGKQDHDHETHCSLEFGSVCLDSGEICLKRNKMGLINTVGQIHRNPDAGSVDKYERMR